MLCGRSCCNGNNRCPLPAALYADRFQLHYVGFVKARGGATVYVDYLQNIKGKTVAGPYCVRARPGAPVSMPLEWTELTEGLDPRDFTIANVPDRFAKVGDIWGETMKKKNNLRALI